MKLNWCNLPCCIISWVFFSCGVFFLYILLLVLLLFALQKEFKARMLHMKIRMKYLQIYFMATFLMMLLYFKVITSQGSKNLLFSFCIFCFFLESQACGCHCIDMK